MGVRREELVCWYGLSEKIEDLSWNDTWKWRSTWNKICLIFRCSKFSLIRSRQAGGACFKENFQNSNDSQRHASRQGMCTYKDRHKRKNVFLTNFVCSLNMKQFKNLSKGREETLEESNSPYCHVKTCF